MGTAVRRNIIQNANTPSELHSLNGSGDISSITHEPTGTLANKSTEHNQPAGTLKGEPAVGGAQSPLQPSGTDSHQRTFLPPRGLYYAVIAGVIAGVFTALLTIAIILVSAGTFQAAGLQIAMDQLTVKTALALATWELLNVALSLLASFFVGFIVGRITVRRRLGFLASALAGAIFYLITFLVSLISRLPRQSCSKQDTPADWESRNLFPAALSVEHWWGTRESVRNMGTRTPLPDVSLREVDSEAMERWLDDGGASDHEAAYDARGFSPLQFFRP